MEYIEYTVLLLLNIVANLLPPEYFWWFFVAKWGLKMKKIFIAIVACMICNVVWGAPEICPDGCDAGYYATGPDECAVCPANTYSQFNNKCYYPSAPELNTCTPCPAGTGTIGDTAADHDSIDDCIPMEIEEISCNPGYYLPANSQQCTQCPRNFYCPGGQYTEASSDSGITQCPDGLYSPPGSDSADDCGRILHIGEYVLYLRTAKLTSPALHVKIGDVIYYGDMFPA